MTDQTTPQSDLKFPRRFARPTPTSAEGPHPGELLPFEHPTGKAAMALADFFPDQEINNIQQIGSLSFHTFGDSGVGTHAQHAVADALSRDVDQTHPEQGPAFLLHLGDILYGNDKLAGYANKFYRPNENYPNLIFAIPGNHDGEMRSSQDSASLQAYFENFCRPTGQQPPLGVSFGRLMPNQPGAYWRLACPFVNIVGLYSGTGENYGAIAHEEIGDEQKQWLCATLTDIAAEAAVTKKALIIAVHHPPYASGLHVTSFGHPGNPDMLKDIDDCCAAANLWPNAVLSAHAHNYQRYMRSVPQAGAGWTIPYFVAGGGGISPQPAPMPIGPSDGTVTYANGSDGHGYLTLTVSAQVLTAVYANTVDDHRSVFETITMDLTTGRQR